MISGFLSLTVQGELSRQPHCQPLCSTLGYSIQLTSLFNQAFSTTLDHPLGFIGNPEGLLDYLVDLEPSRSSTLHGASWILYYASLPPSHKAGKPRPCSSFIRRHYYFVVMKGWGWSLNQGGRAMLRLTSRASCYRRSSE